MGILIFLGRRCERGATPDGRSHTAANNASTGILGAVLGVGGKAPSKRKIIEQDPSSRHNVSRITLTKTGVKLVERRRQSHASAAVAASNARR